MDPTCNLQLFISHINSIKDIIYILFFIQVFETHRIYYSYVKSQFARPKFQVPDSHLWRVAATLISVDCTVTGGLWGVHQP